MARSPDWSKPALAEGAAAPRWPLPTVTPAFARWSFGGGRPFGCAADQCERWHAGIDLTGAPDGALVVAPEDALVVAVDRGWSAGSKALFLRTDTGLFLVLGGLRPGSHQEFGVAAGQRVLQGERLGRVLGTYGMIHLETYVAADRGANSVWRVGQPPPRGILNPTRYVERMAGDAAVAEPAEPAPSQATSDPPSGPASPSIPRPDAPPPSRRLLWALVGGAAVSSAAIGVALWWRQRRSG